jgi:hypothetical protein
MKLCYFLHVTFYESRNRLKENVVVRRGKNISYDDVVLNDSVETTKSVLHVRRTWSNLYVKYFFNNLRLKMIYIYIKPSSRGL